MGKRIARLLGLEGQTPYVRAFMVRSNTEVMRRITSVLAVLCAAVFLTTYTPFVFWQGRAEDILTYYRIQLGSMVLINVLFAWLSRRYLQSATASPRSGQWYLRFYVALLTGINLWITVLDFAEMRRYFFLLVMLFLLFGLFFISPLESLVFMSVVFAVTIGGLGLTGLLSPIQIIILTCYIVVIWAVSIANYLARINVAATNEHILDLSRRDELTGALNRRAFDEDMTKYSGHSLFLILSDVDEFKFYNDLYGHALGDHLLTSFAACLTEAFGDEHVYRFGSDEYIAVVEGDDEERLNASLVRLRDRFHITPVDGRNLSATCSVGCVHGLVEDEDDMRDMLRMADVLLYRSKDSGRDQMTFAERNEGLMREAVLKSDTYVLPEANLDALTGLADKEYFISHCSEIAPVMLKQGHQISFAYFNVASMKDYNSKYGFAEGDELLVLVAQTLKEVFPGRMLSRFGDDRFVLMGYDEGLADGITRAYGIVQSAYQGRLTSLRAGVFRYTSPTIEVRHACDCARIACDSLRGHYDMIYRYYTDELGSKMEQRNRVIESFDVALREGYIQPFYQPIIRSVSDLVCEFEVLARWIDPQRGMRAPDDFIPALEDAHLIHLLDLRILEEVCKNYRKLRDMGQSLWPVSINFSRLDFEACDLPSEVIGLLDRYELPHGIIRVEVTESAFAENSDLIKSSLMRLRAAGMQVWMDDFGSGYSALNVLREYDFDLVKFDMSFLRGMDATDPSDPSGIMLTSLVDMAKELGLQTLVEGVETVDQLFFLKGISCEKFQGYVFGRPHSFEEVCDRLSSWTYMVEDSQKRVYYDQIGRINLLQPVEPGSEFDPTGVADGIPVAVIERDEQGTLHFLEHNAAYAMRLERLGFAGTLDAEQFINKPSSRELLGVEGLAQRALATDGWIRIENPNFELANGYIRCVAQVAQGSSAAVMFCTSPVDV